MQTLDRGVQLHVLAPVPTQERWLKRLNCPPQTRSVHDVKFKALILGIGRSSLTSMIYNYFLPQALMKRNPGIRAESLRDQVYHYLQQEIVEGRMNPGERILENDCLSSS